MGSRRARWGGTGRLGLLLVLLATASSASTGSERGAIEGRVLGPEGHPLIQVLVRLDGNDLVCGRTQETDERGRFRFDRLRPDTYGLLIDEPGFARLEDRAVVLSPGATVRIEVELWLDPYPDPEAPLYSAGERRALDWSADATGLVLTRADLDLLPLGHNPWSAAWLSTAAWPSEDVLLGASPVFSFFRIAGVDVDRALVQLHPKWGGREPWLDGEVFLWPGRSGRRRQDPPAGRLPPLSADPPPGPGLGVVPARCAGVGDLRVQPGHRTV